MPIIMARAVISTGRKRVKPASSAALTESLPSIIFSVAKLTTRMLFEVATPMHMMAPMSAGTLKVRVRYKQEPGNPGERCGQRGNHDERIQPGLKIDYDQQVNQYDRERQARSGGQRKRLASSEPAHEQRLENRVVIAGVCRQ